MILARLSVKHYGLAALQATWEHTVAGLGSLSQTLTVILARPNIASESLLFRASDGVLGRPQSLSLDVAQMLVCLRSKHSVSSERKTDGPYVPVFAPVHSSQFFCPLQAAVNDLLVQGPSA